MPSSIYITKTVREIRKKGEVKRNFLREMFFKKTTLIQTDTVLLETKRGGEFVAPLVTPLESGRPLPDKTRKTNEIQAPNVGISYGLTPKDYFERPVGAQLSGGENPTISAAKKVGEVLKDQENYISNREELMTSQFLTSGKVEAIDGDAGYVVDYELENIETLPVDQQWDKEGVDPLVSLDRLISTAEENGEKVENVVMGLKAAQIFLDKLLNSKKLSKDSQSEIVKKVVREHPGVVWLGTYTTYGIELYRYNRTVTTPKGEKINLISTNIVVGGPTGGEILYAPIINMGAKTGSEVHITARYSCVSTPTDKTKLITTEARPVLQPVELTGYFSATVCTK